MPAPPTLEEPRRTKADAIPRGQPSGLGGLMHLDLHASGEAVHRRRSRRTATMQPMTMPTRRPMKPSSSTLDFRSLLALVAPAKRETSPLRGAWLVTAAVY